MSSGSRQMANGGAHRQAGGVNDRNRIIRAIAHHHRRAIRRDPGQPRICAHAQRSHNRPMIEVEHGNIVRPRVRHVSAAPVGRDVDKIRPPIDANGCDDFVVLRVNYADVRRARVDDIHLVFLRISRNSGRLHADRQRSDDRKSPNRVRREVDHRNRVTLPIRDVSVFAIERPVEGKKRALVKVIPAPREDEGNADGDEKKFTHGQRHSSEGKKISDDKHSIF